MFSSVHARVRQRPPAERDVVGEHDPERGQRHRADDGDRLRVMAEPDPLALMQAELTHRLGAELDLVLTSERVPAGGRRHYRPAGVTQHAHRWNFGPVNGQLGEAQLRPAEQAVLVRDDMTRRIRRIAGLDVIERVEVAGRPAAPAAGRLHQQVPRVAVPGRVRREPAQAGAEHQRGHERGDRCDRASQRGQHRRAEASGTTLEGVPDPGHHSDGQRGASGRGQQRRRPWLWQLAGFPHRPPRQPRELGQEDEQEDRAAAAED